MFVSRSAFVVAVTMALSAQSAAAQAHPAFKPLAFLVGSCWIGTFPDGKQTDEHCFEWVYEKKFIRDRHVVRGGAPYQGETTYRVDPKTSAVSYWYISSEGLVVTGLVENTTNGLAFPSQYSTPKGDVELKALWIPVGSDAYRVTSSRKAGDSWKEMWSMEIKRQPR